jgi:hypothetical protein
LMIRHWRGDLANLASTIPDGCPFWLGKHHSVWMVGIAT